MVLNGDGFYRLFSGRLIKDAEHKRVGPKNSHLTKLAVAYGSDAGAIINVTAWNELAAHTANLKKNDRVMATGVIKSNDYNGRKYWELEADCITVSPNGTVVMSDEVPSETLDGFQDVIGDDIPF